MLFRALLGELNDLTQRFVSAEAPVVIKIKGQPPFEIKRVVLENHEDGQTVWLDAEEM